jgi:ATP-dependent RNA helicase DeaD
VHILVATPGRLIDLIWNTDLDLSRVGTLVLDEVDEMLDMGFLEDVDFIMSCLIHDHQTLLFSATMPAAIDRLARTYLKDPLWVELNTEHRSPQSIQHHFQHTGPNRLPALIDYLQSEDIQQSIIFCNSRDKGSRLLRDLRETFKSLAFMHGGLDQEQRTFIFNQFRRQQIKLMIATDVAARGLDFTHVSHVINYDAPRSHDIYTHRTGRTGRMGRLGIAMTLVTDRELQSIKRLLQSHHIAPIWHGAAPNLGSAARKRRETRRRRPSRRTHRLAQHQTTSTAI